MVEPVLKHSWPKNYKDAVRLQESLRSKLILENHVGDVRYVAGADVSYDKGSDYYHAAVVVLKFPDMETVEEASASGKAPFPYIPGLLAFREGPIVMRAFKKLKTRPDVILLDGHGIAHPRGFGIASHMGILLGIPTIGCAKTVLVGDFKEPGKKRGSQSPLVYKDMEVGRALRTRDSVKPVFVSVGHMVSLDAACEVALECCTKYRIPEPTRRAHILVNKIRTLTPCPSPRGRGVNDCHSEQSEESELINIYHTLFSHYGPQHWWPGETPFEVMVGAILTQNTNWTNVEKAINNLKKARALTPEAMDEMPADKLAGLIKPSGYFNIKAKRLKAFISYFMERYSGNIKKMREVGPIVLREELLSITGIGPETSDSIMLYALDMPVFVIDAYTKRIFSRHGFFPPDWEYHDAQKFFMDSLPKDVKLYNEYHALIVRLAKEKCAKKAGQCDICVLMEKKIYP